MNNTKVFPARLYGNKEKTGARIEVFLLRELNLVNGILTNLEVAYGLSQDDIIELEKVDEMLLRKILSTSCSTPKEALYLELGCVPLRYAIISRRLNYLHHILTRPANSLLLNFF